MDDYKTFFNWLTEVVFEYDFEDNPEYYIEIICRYLVKFGYAKLENGNYSPIKHNEGMAERSDAN